VSGECHRDALIDPSYRSSQQYRDMLANSRAEKRQSREPRLTEGGEAFMPDDRSVAGSTSTWGVVHIDPSENADPTDELRAPSSKLPWAISTVSLLLHLPHWLIL
jgi:1-phosphatidylinositol-3-phosphate 5-kinase